HYLATQRDSKTSNTWEARSQRDLGNNFWEYHVDEPPRVVLDKLEKVGFSVVTMTGVG
uniref:GTP cyclohydrolase 1 feedback regulatory protein n=1 Tax=Oncorhynchus mykiss TaxID=8022 RepID=A0A8K9XKM9_ONCMY